MSRSQDGSTAWLRKERVENNFRCHVSSLVLALLHSYLVVEGPLAHGKAHSSSSIKIKVSNRRRNKFVTTVSGLESELPASVTLKDMCKVISNKFAVGASVIKSEDGNLDEITVIKLMLCQGSRI
eukprot:754554-Hanusia_phi.AAC.3